MEPTPSPIGINPASSPFWGKGMTFCGALTGSKANREQNNMKSREGMKGRWAGRFIPTVHPCVYFGNAG